MIATALSRSDDGSVHHDGRPDEARRGSLPTRISAGADDPASRSPAGAIPGEVLEELVPLVIGEIGEQRRAHRLGRTRRLLARARDSRTGA